MATEHEMRKISFLNIPQLHFITTEHNASPSDRVALGNITNHTRQSVIVPSMDKSVALPKNCDEFKSEDEEDDDETYFSPDEVEDHEIVSNANKNQNLIIPDSDEDETDLPNLCDLNVPESSNFSNLLCRTEHDNSRPNDFLLHTRESNKLVKLQ